MAKPIRATPELRGSEAKTFVRKMVQAEKARITRKDIKLAEIINYFPF